MFKELDVVVLTATIPLDHTWDIPSSSPLIKNGNPKEGLKAGDVGTIVYMQGKGEAFDVEFLDHRWWYSGHCDRFGISDASGK